MVPVRDVPRAAASPLKSGHHVAPPVPRERKPQKETTQGGWEGARGTTEESSKTQNPFLPFVCSPVWGCHSESPANSLRGKSADFLLEELQGRGLPGDLVHGLGLTFSRKSFREEASLGTFKASSGGGARET